MLVKIPTKVDSLLLFASIDLFFSDFAINLLIYFGYVFLKTNATLLRKLVFTLILTFMLI